MHCLHPAWSSVLCSWISYKQQNDGPLSLPERHNTTHMHAHIRTHAQSHTHIHMLAHICIPTHTYTRMHTCAHAYTHTHAYTHVNIHTHALAHAHTHACPSSQARVERYFELVDRSRDTPDADTKVDFASSSMMRQGVCLTTVFVRELCVCVCNCVCVSVCVCLCVCVYV